jgi:hypothetical protein
VVCARLVDADPGSCPPPVGDPREWSTSPPPGTPVWVSPDLRIRPTPEPPSLAIHCGTARQTLSTTRRGPAQATRTHWRPGWRWLATIPKPINRGFTAAINPEVPTEMATEDLEAVFDVVPAGTEAGAGITSSLAAPPPGWNSSSRITPATDGGGGGSPCSSGAGRGEVDVPAGFPANVEGGWRCITGLAAFFAQY